MAGDLTVNALYKAFASLTERVNASDIAARIRACDSWDELQRVWSSLKHETSLTDEERVVLHRIVTQQKERLLPVPSLYGRLFEEVRREDFASRHGRGRDELSDALRESLGERPLSDVAPEEVAAVVNRWAKESPRRYALFRLSREIKWNSLKGVPRQDARDVFQLRDAIAECLGAITTTEKNAVDAFAEAFAGARERIDARSRRQKRTARYEQDLRWLWNHFKASDEYKAQGAAVYLEGAEKSLKRMKELNPGRKKFPALSMVEKHFRKMLAEKDGVVFKRGPRPRSNGSEKSPLRAAD